MKTAMPIIAITGATGFVGRAVVARAKKRGIMLRALTRHPRPLQDHICWIEGTLSDERALLELCKGASALLHIAGVVNAPHRQGFIEGNITGTLRLAKAAKTSNIARFVHVSSLAARHPQLSDYGWSKKGAEDAVKSAGLNWAMVRPPAIYGPHDREMLELFKMAQKGLVMMPPKGRASYLHVDDLARLLLNLAEGSVQSGRILEADDGQEDGWSHREFAQTLGGAIGQDVRIFHAPATLLKLAAFGDRLIRGNRAKLTADRASYMAHPNWVSDPQYRPAANLWQPKINLQSGLVQTAKWYRDAGWLESTEALEMAPDDEQ